MINLTSNSLADLDPAFQPMVEAWITRCNAALAPSSMRVTVTYRSGADQDAAKAAGLSKAAAGASPHNCTMPDGSPGARAVDFGVFGPDGSYVTDGSDPRYAQCGWIAVDMNMFWGGNWTLAVDNCEPDADHIQMINWRTA
jgi:hypothetical protein